jgi:hypothetical protein
MALSRAEVEDVTNISTNVVLLQGTALGLAWLLTLPVTAGPL